MIQPLLFGYLKDVRGLVLTPIEAKQGRIIGDLK
jgi:hypothetical protein